VRSPKELKKYIVTSCLRPRSHSRVDVHITAGSHSLPLSQCAVTSSFSLFHFMPDLTQLPVRTFGTASAVQGIQCPCVMLSIHPLRSRCVCVCVCVCVCRAVHTAVKCYGLWLASNQIIRCLSSSDKFSFHSYSNTDVLYVAGHMERMQIPYVPNAIACPRAIFLKA
jgi:hypothetical protein